MAIEVIGADTANTKGTTISGGTAGVKGSYVELSGSISMDAKWITVQVSAEVANPLYYAVVYVATGAASSEVDQVSLVFPLGRLQGSISLMLPFSATTGDRIAVATKVNNSAANVSVWAAISDEDSFGSPGGTWLLGETDSMGTEIDPGGTANTKGSWTELEASTPHDINLIWVVIAGNANLAIAANGVMVDIGTGAASSETVLVANVPKQQDTSESVVTAMPIFVPTIPSGTRIAARAQSSTTDADDRKVDVSIVGAYVTPPSGGGGGGETAHVFAA